MWIIPGLERLVGMLDLRPRPLTISVENAPSREHIPVTLRGYLYYIVDPRFINQADRWQHAPEDLDAVEGFILGKAREAAWDVLETTSLNPQLQTSVRDEVKTRLLHRLQHSGLPDSVRIVDFALGPLQPDSGWQQAIAQYHQHQHMMGLSRSLNPPAPTVAAAPGSPRKGVAAPPSANGSVGGTKVRP